MGDECHAQNFGGVVAHFRNRFGDLDAAALAATAGVNLRLDDPDLAAQRFSRLDGIVNRETRDTARRGDPLFTQDFLALIFMNVHGC